MRFRLLGTLAMVAMIAACSHKPADTNTENSNGEMNRQGAGIGTGNGSVQPGTEQDLAQNVGDRVFFGTNESSVSGESRATLDRQSGLVEEVLEPDRHGFEGHCDERGTREYNLALGERRADAVKRLPGGFRHRCQPRPDDQLRQGASLAVEGSDAQAWSQNRRGVTVVTNQR